MTAEEAAALIDGALATPAPAVTPPPVKPPPVVTPTPVTFYSTGKAVGGPDESQDTWTNRGYTATGKNLTEGVAAVNTSEYPLGTVFRDSESGTVFLAADKHGNRDPKVVDLYTDPSRYQSKKMTRDFQVIGKVDKVPDTPEGVRAVLAGFGGKPAPEAATPPPAAEDYIDVPGLPSGAGAGVPPRVAGAVQPAPPADIPVQALGKAPGPIEVRKAERAHPMTAEEAAALIDAPTPKMDRKAAEALVDRPYWVESGEIRFEPGKYRMGLKAAKQDGVIDQATFDAKQEFGKKVDRAAYERKMLEIQAGDNAPSRAALHGFGKGAAMTFGGIAGAGAGGIVAPAAGPAAPFVPIVTGAAGMFAGGALYDQTYKMLADWHQNWDEVLKASELHPGWDQVGQISFLAMPLPASAINMAKAVKTVAGAEGALAATKFAGKAVATGAAAGAVADVATKNLEQSFDPKATGPTVESTAEAAGLGALFSGLFVRGKHYSLKDLYGIAEKKTRISEQKAAGKTPKETISAEEEAAISQAARAGEQAQAEGTVKGVTVEQASMMGRPEVTQPTVTIEPNRAQLPRQGSPPESFAPPENVPQVALEAGEPHKPTEAGSIPEPANTLPGLKTANTQLESALGKIKSAADHGDITRDKAVELARNAAQNWTVTAKGTLSTQEGKWQDLRSAIKLPNGIVKVGKYGEDHERMLLGLDPEIVDAIGVSDIGYADARTGEFLSEEMAVKRLSDFQLTHKEIVGAGAELSKQTGGEYEAVRGGMASEELVKAQKARDLQSQAPPEGKWQQMVEIHALDPKTQSLVKVQAPATTETFRALKVQEGLLKRLIDCL